MLIDQPANRAALFPGSHVFTSPVGEIAHSLGMGTGAVCLALDQRRPAAGTGSGDRFPGDAEHFERVVAVQLEARHAVVRRTPAHIGDTAGVLEGHFGGELVVLADEQCRQFPDAGHVQAFVEGPVVHGTIAEEGHANRAVLQDLGTVPAPAGLQDAWADDAAGSHHADFGREQVHTAAPATGTTHRLAEQFRDQFLRRHPLGQGVAVAAMRTEDRVLGGEVCAHPGGNRFLPDVGVTRPVDQTALMTTG